MLVELRSYHRGFIEWCKQEQALRLKASPEQQAKTVFKTGQFGSATIGAMDIQQFSTMNPMLIPRTAPIIAQMTAARIQASMDLTRSYQQQSNTNTTNTNTQDINLNDIEETLSSIPPTDNVDNMMDMTNDDNFENPLDDVEVEPVDFDPGAPGVSDGDNFNDDSEMQSHATSFNVNDQSSSFVVNNQENQPIIQQTQNSQITPRKTNTPHSLTPRVNTPKRKKSSEILREASIKQNRKQDNNFNREKSVLRKSKIKRSDYKQVDKHWDNNMAKLRKTQDAIVQRNFTKAEQKVWTKISTGFPDV